MTLTERYRNDEVTKAKAKALDDMMRRRELANAYNKGGSDANAQAASAMANGLASQQVDMAQAQRNRMKGDIFAAYQNGEIGLQDMAQSGIFTPEELQSIQSLNTDMSQVQQPQRPQQPIPETQGLAGSAM